MRELADATTQCGSRGSSWTNTTPLGAEALVLGMAALACEAELAILAQSQRHQRVAGTVVLAVVGCLVLAAVLPGMAAAELVAMPADMARELAGEVVRQLQRAVRLVELACARWRLGAELGWIARYAASSPALRCCYHQTYPRSAVPQNRHH